MTVSVDPQHTISGNPSRFRLGATSIREDERWKTEMRRRDRWIVTLCTAPARWILRLAQRQTQLRGVTLASPALRLKHCAMADIGFGDSLRPYHIGITGKSCGYGCRSIQPQSEIIDQRRAYS